MKAYNNPLCNGIEEFQEDMLRIKYVKRLLLRFKKTGDLKTRLLLNHIIILQNVFGVEATVRILFYKLPDEVHDSLKAFFHFLNYLPPHGIPEKNIQLIKIDEIIILELNKIK